MQDKPDIRERRLEIKSKVMQWIDADPSRSQSQLARAAGISPASLSGVLSGNYKAKDLNHIVLLESFFKLETHRFDLLPDPDFIETRQVKKVTNFTKMIHVSKKIGVLVGSSGIGKTLALSEYKKNNPSVFYMPINPMIRAKCIFFKALYGTVMGETSVRNEYAAFEKLAAKGGTQGALIIIDDAHLLYTDRSTNDSAFEIVRTLNDRGIAFIICGNETVRDKVTETNKREFYQQFASRAKILLVEHAFLEADVMRILTSVLGGKPNPEVFDYLYQMASDYYGSLRIAVSTMQLAAFHAHSMNEPLSRAHLESASATVISILKHDRKQAYQRKGKNTHAQKTARENRESVGRDEESTQAVA